MRQPKVSRIRLRSARDGKQRCACKGFRPEQGLECGREFYQRGAGESSIGAISLRDEMKHRHGVGVGASSAWHWCGREFCSGYSLLTLTGIPF